MNTILSEHWLDMLPQILHISGIGLWELTVAGENKHISFSPVVRDLLGYGEEEHIEGIEDFLERFCHPDSREQVGTVLVDVLAGRPHTFHYDMRAWNRHEQNWHWISVFGRSATGTHGAPHAFGAVQDISAAMALHDAAEAREANKRTRMMLDAMPVGCSFWDQNGERVDCNQAIVNLFGLKDKNEYLENYRRLSPEFQPCGGRSAELAAAYRQQAFVGGGICFEWMHQTLSGEPIPVEVALVRLDWGGEHVVVSYVNDLRELKAAKTELDRERVLLKEIMRNSPVCMMILVDNTIRFTTPYTGKFLGVSAGDTVNKLRADARQTEVLKEELRRNGFVDWLPVTVNSTEKGTLEMLCNAYFTEYYGEAGLIVWLADVTELRAQERELLLARDAAEASTRAKSEFIATMSHELRTPMNAILGMTHLMRRTNLTEKQYEYMEKTDQAGRALLTVINDILDFSAIETGGMAMEKNTFSVENIIRDVMAETADSCRKKRLIMRFYLPLDLPEVVEGDPRRLHQVLCNLADNAVKFTQAGTITIRVAVREKNGGTITLEFGVTDTGIGIPDELAMKLFDPFTQADSSDTRRYGGTGLGLSICKSLVERMHGAIWCENATEGGSTFRFTARFGLAAQKTDESAFGEAHPLDVVQNSLANDMQAALALLAPLKGTRILLVEDTPLNQMVAEELLEAAGIEADIANNGREALEKLERDDYPLILMDIQMPVMDGLAATRVIRSQQRHEHTPIIAMTALSRPDDMQKTRAVGMNGHLTKPIDAVQLYTTLSRWLPHKSSPN